MDGRFSGPTLAALIEIVAGAHSHAELDVLFLRLECQDCDLSDEGGVPPNKLGRVNNVVSTLKRRGPQPGADLLELLRVVIEERFRARIDSHPGDEVPEPLRGLISALRIDGFDLVDGRLVPTTPEPAPMAEELSLLEAALKRRGFDVALQHYRQAVDSYRTGNLEASNGQLRSFLENLVTEICTRATQQRARDPKGATDKLRNAGLIDGDEANLLKGLLGMSNQRGAHAGLTDEEEGLFRLHTSTAVARWLLARVPDGP